MAVPAGAADLLRQVLQALGQVVVDHLADVGLVDPHAEGDGGDDHGVRRLQEPVLHPGPLVVFHAGVVGAGRQTRLRQGRRHVLGRLLLGDVDDGRSGGIGRKPLEQQGVAVGGEDRGGPEQQVLAVEAGADGVFGRDVEAAADVVEHLRRGGGREGQDALGAAELAEAGELQIVGAEVVPPLGDAVGLVDREKRYPDPGDRLPEAFVVEAFRGDVEEAQGALADGVHEGAHLVARERRVKAAGGHSARGELIDLVLHQGDQGRHHEGEARQQEGRDLVAERLAAAGGEDGRGGPSGQEVPDHLFLPGAELPVAEGLRERRTGGLQVRRALRGVGLRADLLGHILERQKGRSHRTA